MKNQLKIIILISFIFVLASCKKDSTDFYEYSDPTFNAYQIDGVPDEIYAYCISHAVYMDSIYTTSPLNIKSRHYFHGDAFSIDERFLIADTFIPHSGKWQFVFYGRKVINGLPFSVYLEKEF